MKTIPVPEPQLAALREGADSVVVYLEDERLQGYEKHTGNPLAQAVLEDLAPHSKGDVLWVQCDSWVCERCKVVRWEEAEVLCWECNGPEAETRDAEMVFLPADQMPEQAARVFVRVEDVGVETKLHTWVETEAAPYPDEEGNPVPVPVPMEQEQYLWALTLAPTEKP